MPLRVLGMVARMTAPRTTKAAMERALDAVQARGLTVASIEIKPDGTIRIETPVAGISETAQPAIDYDGWRAKRIAKG